MVYEPLHHKYRPQTFAELVGQQAIATTLTNALRQQKIAPAYLFTGARGTGKTSSARILAKSLNCLQSEVPTEKPCGVCEVCQSIARGSALDVIEIDAASNTGVDNIRELIERAQFAPVQCRYKVYVLDEVHMLTGQAFNALLKTLEEPPNRVVFVLATTDPQRVLPTIISRCQRFDFRRIELEAMVGHLSQIAVKESIDATPEAVQLVAQIAQGGLRDAESMLDQLSLLEHQITIERVWDLVGAVPERDLLALVQAIAQNDSTRVIDGVRHLMDRGREPLIVLQNLASFYRDLLIAKTTPARNDLVAITPPTWAEMTKFAQALEISTLLKGQQHLRSSEVQIKNTTQPRLWLEVTLLGLMPAAIDPPATRQDWSVGQVASPAVAIPSAANGAKPVPAPALPVPSVEPVSVEPASIKPALPEPELAPVPFVPNSVPDSVPIAIPAAQETTPAQATPQLSVNLEQMWQQIIQVLHPPGTQALFKQQGRLLALTESSAKIGISSQPLFKMAQLRVANLEAALAQLTQQTIKVSLEVVPVLVASVTSEPTGTNSEAASGATISATAEAPTALPSASAPPRLAARELAINGNSSSNGNGSSNSPSAAEIGNSYDNDSTHSDPTQIIAPPAVAPELPQAWQNEDDVSRAAKSLAQMFNGQIVNYDEEIQAVASADASRLGQVDLVGDGDPDGDVPF